MSTDVVGVTVVGAVTLMVILTGGLTVAILGAILTALFPGRGTRLRAWARWALSVALRLFSLVWLGLVALVGLALVMLVAVFRLVGAIAVTYFHTFASDRETKGPQADGRHRKGFGRMFGRSGQHRRRVHA